MAHDRTWAEELAAHAASPDLRPLLACGEAGEVLRGMPDAVFDCCMTSPPYWGQRQYSPGAGGEAGPAGDEPTGEAGRGGGIGMEESPEAYLDAVVGVLAEAARVLKPTGSLWLNMGDAYRDKRLLGLPWRTALRLGDAHGLLLRNEVIWHKRKGAPDAARDRLRRAHEHLFHFVRSPRYHYDLDAIRAAPPAVRREPGRVVSATGVSGARYREQIAAAGALDPEEKAAALAALEGALAELAAGRLADFRMVLRGVQRATHSDEARVSGRARELARRGFYLLRYHPGGAKPGDVWELPPVDTHGRRGHYAAYPEALCRRPILATCPPGGLVLDPFCGTGTTMRAAMTLGRRSVGIELAPAYLAMARARCGLDPIG